MPHVGFAGEYICYECAKRRAQTQIEVDCGATLIVSPAAILEQWKTEIAKHTNQGVPSERSQSWVLSDPALQMGADGASTASSLHVRFVWAKVFSFLLCPGIKVCAT